MNYANRLIDMMMQELPDELDVRRIEAGLNRLRQEPGSDLATCYQAISLARVLRMDRNSALDAARNAMRMRPVSPAVNINLITTFLNLGEIDDAARVADRCRRCFKGDLHLLTAVLLAYVHAFRFEDALAVCYEGTELLAHAPGFNACRFEAKAVEDLMGLRDEHGYTAEMLNEIFYVAIAVLVEAGAGPLRFSRSAVPDGTFVHHFHVNRSPDECAALGWTIAERLVERSRKTGAEVMSLACLPVTTYRNLQKDSAT